MHYYWSRDWVSDNMDEPAELGETGCRRDYDKGVPPPNWMAPVVIGEPECIFAGETMLPPLAPPEIPAHFDLEEVDKALVVGDVLPFFQEPCHPSPRSGLETLRNYLMSTIEPAHMVASMIGIICRIYVNDPDARTAMKHALGEWLFESQVDPDDTILPGSAIVIGKYATLVAISGTTNVTQWVVQITQSPGPMLARDNYRTFAMWEAAGTRVFSRLKATGDDGKKPILLAGHSLGGATAAIVAAKLLAENARRDVRLLTYGSPKQGNLVLKNWLGDIPQLHMVNPSDPVPFTPVDANYRTLGIPNPPLAPWFEWDQYVSLSPTMWVDGSRNLIPINPNLIPRRIVADYVIAALTNTSFDPGEPHYSTTYRDILGG